MAIVFRIEKLIVPAGIGDCKLEGFAKANGTSDWFIADSFSFGVERELKESGEKSGTEDINIGLGELQECSVSKSMDNCSAVLAQAAISGNSLGITDIGFVQTAGGGSALAGMPVCYLWIRLWRTFIKSWSTSGDADDRPTEEVAFLYNKICMSYAATVDGSSFKHKGTMGWDNVKGVRDKAFESTMSNMDPKTKGYKIWA